MRRSIGIIALTMGALLAVALLAFHLHKRSTEEVVAGFQDQQLLMARHVATQIASYLRDRSQRVRLLSTLASSKPLDLDRLSKNIDDYFQYVKTKSVKAITVYDEAGKVIYSTSNIVAAAKDTPANILAWARKPENQGKVYLSPIVVPSAPGERLPSYALLLFEPVRFESALTDDPRLSPRPAGGISLIVDMNELLSGQLALVSPKMKAPQAWIIDENGTLLFHSEHPEMVLRSVRHRDAQCDQCHISMNYVEKILREKQGIVDYTLSNSSKKLAAFAPIEFEEARWIVVVNAPYDAVTAFVRRSFRDTLMLLAVTVLALVTGSSFVYRDYRSRIRAEEEALQWREKRALEEKARESEERYRRLVELSPDAIFIQCDGKIVFINAAGSRLLGATQPDQILGRSVLEMIHPDYQEIVKERIKRLGEGRDLPALEEKYVRLDGSFVEVEVVATPFTYHDKPAAQVIVRDITERRRADSLLRKSEEHFRSLIENASDLIFVLNADRTIRYGSPSIQRALGYKPEDYIGKDALEFADPADIPGIVKSISRSVRQPGDVATVEHRIKSKDGIWLFFESRGRTLLDPESGLTAVVNSHDITDRKRAEQALRESGEFNRQIISSAQEGIIVYDRNLRYVVWNPYMERLTGLISKDVLGKDPLDLFPFLREEGIYDLLKRALAGESASSPDIKFTSPSSRGGWMSGRYSPLYDVKGEIVGVIAFVGNVTVRKEMEDALRESERRYRGLVELSPDAIFVQYEGEIVFINAAGLKLFGAVALNDMLGKPVLSFVHPDFRRAFTRQILLLREGTKVPLTEMKYLGLGGAPMDVEVAATPFTYQNKPAAQLIVRDITERKRVERALLESEERFKSALEHAAIGKAIVGLDGRFLKVNRSLCEIVGYSEEELLATDFQTITHPDDLNEDLGYTRQMLAGEIQTYKMEKRYRHKSGHTVWVFLSVSLLRDSQAKPLYFIAQIQDITERKRAEDAILKRSRQLQILSRAAQEINSVLEVPVIMRSLVASAMELVDAKSGGAGLMLDGKIVFTEYNKEGTVIPIDYSFMAGQGVPGWVLEGRKPYIANDAEHDPQVLPEIQKALGFHELVNVPIFSRRGELLGVFEIHNTRGGTGFDENDVDLLQGLAASAAGAFENAQILIERSQAEMETARQKTLFQQLFENAPAGIALLDEHDRIIQVNKGFEAMFHFSSHEVLGRRINETVVSEEFSEEASLLSSRVLQGETVKIQSTRRSKDGALIPVQIYGVPIVINQRQTGIYGMYVDLSESKRLEEQFRQAQKMEAVGRLAGGVAHDFNNLLTAIMGYSELLLVRLEGSDPLRKNVEEIKKAGERAASLTRQLLAFSRRQVLQPQVMDLNIVVSGMEKLVRRLIGEDIDLRLGLQSPLGSVKADPGQIEQVILNLVVNSRDAMPHGGRLTIETKSIVLDEEYIWKHPGAKPGTYVMLIVSDTGSGMSTEVQSHLFEPFFTTKEKGKGTGLGLSTVYGIVKQSNGYISAYSEAGRGTTFKVYLPLVNDLAANAKAPVEPEKWVAGSETVLLVEDEQAIRGLMQAMLRMKGYTVLEAADGQEALSLFKGNEDRIDLVITDVVMPRMSGRELATRIVADRPKTKVLFVSGYSEEAVLYQGIFQPGTAFLQKPFTPDSLARKVREVLDN